MGRLMKRYIFALIISLSLSGLGCSKYITLPAGPPPTPTPVPTATPTPNLTPVCSFTPLGSARYWTVAGGPTTFVIQDAAQWTSVNGVGFAPPVNFSTQMVLEVSEMIFVSCGWTGFGPSITSVCVYSDHIEVNYQHGGATPPNPTPPYTCGSFLSYYAQDLVAIPQSNLPVFWYGH